MPALESGGNRTIRRTPEVSKPLVYAPPKVSAPAFQKAIPKAPFQGVQQHLQRNVERTQRALPKQPTPSLPRIANPTRQQSLAALTIAHEHAPKGAAQSQRYWQEVKSDPRQRGYVKTLEHYANALQSGNPAYAPGQRSIAKPAPAPKDAELPLLGFAHVRIPGTGKLEQGIGNALASIAPGLTAAGPESGFMRNLGSDALSIGEFPIVAGYKASEAAAQAAVGNNKPSGQLAEGFAKSIANGAVGKAVQGDFKGALEQVKEHPLISASEVLGPVSAGGRVAGAATRAAGSTVEDTGVRGTLARAGSNVRAPIGLTSDAGAARAGNVRQRSFSKDLTRKGVQALADRKREPVLDEHGQPVTIKERGRTVQVLKPTKREEEAFQKRRANFEASRTQGTEHTAREEARKAVNAAEGSRLRPAVKGTVAKELTSLAATGTIRSVKTFAEDLGKRAGVIERAIAHGDFRHGEELKAAEANAKMLRKASLDPKILSRAPQIMEQGLAYAKLLNEGDKPLAALDVHPEAQLGRSALTEYALAHMNARHYSVQDHAAIERELLAQERKLPAGSPERQAIRQQRLETSGRPQHLMERHEAAKGDALNARKRVAQANVALRRAQRARDGLIRLHASKRAAEGMRTASAAEKAKMEAATAQVTAAEHAVKAASAAAKQASDAVPRKPPIGEAIRGPRGRVLTDKQIREHATASGRNPDTLAYLPHVTGTGRKGAFHRPFRPIARPSGTTQARTGHLFQRGATAFGRDVVRENAAAKATTVNAVRAFDKFVHESGIKHPDLKRLQAKAQAGGKLTPAERRIVTSKGHFTPKEATELATRLEKDGGTPLIPVRAFGASKTGEVRGAISEAQSPTAMETAHHALLNGRIVSATDTATRNVVLVPKHQIDQLLRQLKPAGEVEKGVQMLNGPFRRAVLPQPRWLTGNFIEPFMVRLPLSGAGINLPGAGLDAIAGRKALNAMLRSSDPAVARAAQEIKGSQLGGLFVGKRGASVRRTYEDFTGNAQRVLYGMHIARNLPAVKQLGDLAVSLTNGFFHLNRVIESTAQYQAFGKQVRADIQSHTNSWIKTVTLGEKAIAEVAKGLVGTPTQHRFMEAQHELLGQYDSFNPFTRRLVQSIAPFMPWTLASMRFVYWTLPAHHTAAFSAFYKLGSTVIEKWEQEHKFLSPEAKEGTLSDAIVRKDKGLVDLTRYTPFGITAPVAHGGGLESLSNTINPQLSGAFAALGGKDPFGRPGRVPKTASNPKGEPTGPDKAEAFASSLLESMVPLISQGKRVEEGGGTGYFNSNFFADSLRALKGEPQPVKPGSKHMSAIDRTFNPFRPTYLKGPVGGVSGGHGAATDPFAARLQRLREGGASTQASGTAFANRLKRLREGQAHP